MNLVTYDPGTGPRAGVIDGEEVVDATALLGAAVTLRDIRAPILQPPTVRDHIAFEEHAT